jgi:hypothetical protein
MSFQDLCAARNNSVAPITERDVWILLLMRFGLDAMAPHPAVSQDKDAEP